MWPYQEIAGFLVEMTLILSVAGLGVYIVGLSAYVNILQRRIKRLESPQPQPTEEIAAAEHGAWERVPFPSGVWGVSKSVIS